MSATTMALLTALLTLVFLGVLAVALIKLNPVLERVGGTPTSYLARLRFGLRAIERETSHLPGQVGRINLALGGLVRGLIRVDGELERAKMALKKQVRS